MIFKTTVEIKYPNSALAKIGTASILFYPYLKKTQSEILMSKRLIDKKEIQEEINRILDLEN